jgi:hypothetical protein
MRPPAFVDVYAGYDEDISIQLVWTTPGDPDETDTDGADLDLHFVRSPGCWNDLKSDCHFRSMQPDWGRPGDVSDNPSLDFDDPDGGGPETVSLDNPELGVSYRVGVHYSRDNGWGPSNANAKIFVGDTIVLERTRTLTTGQFWDVAGVAWPSGEIVLIDRVYSRTEDANAAIDCR